MNGILPLWKPRGLTSHDCVQKVRKIFQTRKIGHTGTLDPEVEGVLVLCIGEATKLVQYLTKVKKTYIAQCTLGQATETEDQTGKIIEEVKINSFPSENELIDVLNSFKGRVTQIPPMYSAVRVRGKRLYEYARNNEYIERPKRMVDIYEIDLLKLNPENNSFSFKTTCSAGTFIRTLCVDIGKKLGFPAHMSYLVRTESSNFTKDEAFTFADLEKAKNNDTLAQLLYSKTRALVHFDEIQIDEQTRQKVIHGQKLPKPKHEIKTEPFKLMHNKKVVALYKFDQKDPSKIRPERVFNT
ncbi:MAG TPA: tRNA pseudouridine(55) synthase TruB [Bacillota bacterium]|nr:tRNA pseudouridine(55) synthase TruB [Bacillota bacterium]